MKNLDFLYGFTEFAQKLLEGKHNEMSDTTL